MYILCNIMIRFSSFANIIIGSLLKGGKNQFLWGENWKEEMCACVLHVVHETCYTNRNKSCSVKNVLRGKLLSSICWHCEHRHVSGHLFATCNPNITQDVYLYQKGNCIGWKIF